MKLKAKGSITSGGSIPELTQAQRMEFLIGPAGASAFSSETEKKRAWADHKHEFLGTLFRRAHAWDLFEDASSGGSLWTNESHENFLERTNQLTAEEQVVLHGLRAEGAIPPRCITRKPTDALFRHFRYAGESHEQFRRRYQLAGLDPWLSLEEERTMMAAPEAPAPGGNDPGPAPAGKIIPFVKPEKWHPL